MGGMLTDGEPSGTLVSNFPTFRLFDEEKTSIKSAIVSAMSPMTVGVHPRPRTAKLIPRKRRGKLSQPRNKIQNTLVR